MELFVRNVNEALYTVLRRYEVCRRAEDSGVPSDMCFKESRNGPVATFREPVTTVYSQPMERVLFSQQRDANPFFHFFEALWMLAGRNDVAFVSQFVKRMREFSDDGITFHAAYGHRWRRLWGADQILGVINELKRTPSTRRAVVAMWDPASDDPSRQGRDLPCNTHIYFNIRERTVDTDAARVIDSLTMTVCNRSNDAIWGAYGANAVHMSMLQEFVAAAVGVPMGWYAQMSNDLHIYTNVVDKMNIQAICKDLVAFLKFSEPPLRLFEWDVYKDPSAALAEIEKFVSNPDDSSELTLTSLTKVAVPMWEVWKLTKQSHSTALEKAADIACPHWRHAVCTWLGKRLMSGGSHAR